MSYDQNDLSFDDIDVAGMEIESLEVVSLKEALALPETGASSGVSSTNSCSSCGSSSTCGSSSKALAVTNPATLEPVQLQMESTLIVR